VAKHTIAIATMVLFHAVAGNGQKRKNERMIQKATATMGHDRMLTFVQARTAPVFVIEQSGCRHYRWAPTEGGLARASILNRRPRDFC
jgi:hypothetical protein